ncbi:MAG: hypothetical protein D6738_01780 [Acidobacteria bacterium]|nr:MAG: hypothetical protein D6738_01780 [Acidobacteriota bacterium]
MASSQELAALIAQLAAADSTRERLRVLLRSARLIAALDREQRFEIARTLGGGWLRRRFEEFCDRLDRTGAGEAIAQLARSAGTAIDPDPAVPPEPPAPVRPAARQAGPGPHEAESAEGAPEENAAPEAEAVPLGADARADEPPAIASERPGTGDAPPSEPVRPLAAAKPLPPPAARATKIAASEGDGPPRDAEPFAPRTVLRRLRSDPGRLRAAGPDAKRRLVGALAGSWAGRRAILALLDQGALADWREAVDLAALLPEGPDRDWVLVRLADAFADDAAAREAIAARITGRAWQRRLALRQLRSS